MNLAKVKIVSDSSSDVFSLSTVDFASVPLTIRTASKEFVDDSSLDTAEMVNHLLTYKGKSSSSCPNPNDWLESFGDAEFVFCITITAALSGSYNSACLAKRQYEEKYPERRVFVLNSRSTGPEMSLIMDKMESDILAGKSFDEVTKGAIEYSKKTGLVFMLESLKNLANNGRVKPIVAKMAGLLGIRMVGKASDGGELEPLDKCRGERKALECILTSIKSLGYNGGRVRIAHCLNEPAANELALMIKSEFKTAGIAICKCGGLCSFYAEKGGLLVGFEKA